MLRGCYLIQYGCAYYTLLPLSAQQRFLADEKDVAGVALPAVEFDRTKKTIASAERSDVDSDKTESEKGSHQVVRG